MNRADISAESEPASRRTLRAVIEIRGDDVEILPAALSDIEAQEIESRLAAWARRRYAA